MDGWNRDSVFNSIYLKELQALCKMAALITDNNLSLSKPTKDMCSAQI